MRLRIFLVSILIAACSSDGSADGDPSNPSGGGSGSGSGGSGGIEPGGNPLFPGAGTSDTAGNIPGSHIFCYYSPDFPGPPAATAEYVFEQLDGNDTVRVRLIFDPGFVDNSYGVNSIGWPSRGGKGHTFEMLHKSDHAIIMMKAGGADVLGMKIDYLNSDATALSGWATAGVMGGDGGMTLGEGSAVVDSMTSLDRNLNERGYSSYTVDSPATDESYTPNPAAPEWDYRVVYEAWVLASIFGGADLDAPRLDYVHASPSKTPNDTLIVEEGEWPPEWECTDPDGCEPGSGGPGDDGDEGGGEMCIANEYGEGCFDQHDNDCDGLTDCADTDCTDKCRPCTVDSECLAGEVCSGGMCQGIID
jgi:hypothetical protein